MARPKGTCVSVVWGRDATDKELERMINEGIIEEIELGKIK